MYADLTTLAILADLAAGAAPLPAPKGAAPDVKKLAKEQAWAHSERLALARAGAVRRVDQATAYAVINAKSADRADALLEPLEGFATVAAGSPKNPAYAVKSYKTSVRKSDGKIIWKMTGEVALVWARARGRGRARLDAAAEEARMDADARATKLAQTYAACDFAKSVHLAEFELSDLDFIPSAA